ncbi:hypothetical protein RJ55_03857 [Drechmeria coniospora]|nr:hypothetical protein RJ55_03857 [Drechmeria coniospora]
MGRFAIHGPVCLSGTQLTPAGTQCTEYDHEVNAYKCSLSVAGCLFCQHLAPHPKAPSAPPNVTTPEFPSRRFGWRKGLRQGRAVTLYSEQARQA